MFIGYWLSNLNPIEKSFMACYHTRFVVHLCRREVDAGGPILQMGKLGLRGLGLSGAGSQEWVVAGSSPAQR